MAAVTGSSYPNYIHTLSHLLPKVGAKLGAYTEDNPAHEDIFPALLGTGPSRPGVTAPTDLSPFSPRTSSVIALSSSLEIPSDIPNPALPIISTTLANYLISDLIKLVLSHYSRCPENNSPMIRQLITLRKLGVVIPDQIPSLVLNKSNTKPYPGLSGFFKECKIAAVKVLDQPSEDPEGSLVVAKGNFASKEGQKFILCFDLTEDYRCWLRAAKWANGDDAPQVTKKKPLTIADFTTLLLTDSAEVVARLLASNEFVFSANSDDSDGDEERGTDSGPATPVAAAAPAPGPGPGAAAATATAIATPTGPVAPAPAPFDPSQTPMRLAKPAAPGLAAPAANAPAAAPAPGPTAGAACATATATPAAAAPVKK